MSKGDVGIFLLRCGCCSSSRVSFAFCGEMFQVSIPPITCGTRLFSRLDLVMTDMLIGRYSKARTSFRGDRLVNSAFRQFLKRNT